MGWVCRFCSTNNDALQPKCIVCDNSKSVASLGCILASSDVRELGLAGDVVIPTEFDVIGEGAFRDRTDITSVMLHDGIKKISKEAFCGCVNLQRVVFSGELDYIDHKAFFDCSSLNGENRPQAKEVAGDAYGETLIKKDKWSLVKKNVNKKKA